MIVGLPVCLRYNPLRDIPRGLCVQSVCETLLLFFSPLPNRAYRLPYLNAVLSGGSCSFQGAELWEKEETTLYNRKDYPFF